jgi:hypothetical protein
MSRDSSSIDAGQEILRKIQSHRSLHSKNKDRSYKNKKEREKEYLVTYQHKNHSLLHQEIQVDCQNDHLPTRMDHHLLKHLMKSCN